MKTASKNRWNGYSGAFLTQTLLDRSIQKRMVNSPYFVKSTPRALSVYPFNTLYVTDILKMDMKLSGADFFWKLTNL